MTNATAPGTIALPVEALHANGYNPNSMTTAGFGELVAEVRHLGRLPKPVVVRPNAAGYTIVDGEHGWRAACEVGLAEIPCEVIEADDFEAMRQTYKRNQHGAHHPVLLGRMFRAMLTERSLSQRELAKEIAVSEGAIRTALLYVDAADVRNSYAGPDSEAAIARLSVRQVRAYIALPPRVGEVWLESGADLKKYASALVMRAPFGDGDQAREMQFEPETFHEVIELGLDGGLSARAYVETCHRALWLWAYYQQYRRYVTDLAEYLRPIARLRLPTLITNAIPVGSIDPEAGQATVLISPEQWATILAKCAAGATSDADRWAMINASIRLALRESGVDVDRLTDPRTAEILAILQEAPDFIRESPLSWRDRYRLHRATADVDGDVLLKAKQETCRQLEKRDRVLLGTDEALSAASPVDALMLKGQWSAVTVDGALDAALAQAKREQERVETSALFADRECLTAAVVEALTRFAVVRTETIGEQPATEALRSRLNAVAWPELRLLAGYILGGMAKDAAPGLWLYAVRQEGGAR
jgi:hypothetical protein